MSKEEKLLKCIRIILEKNEKAVENFNLNEEIINNI